MSETNSTDSAIGERIGSRGVWFFTEAQDVRGAVAFAQRIEELGYGALWIPETLGRDPFAHGGVLLEHTESLVLATGIANIFHRHPGAMKQAQMTLAEQSGNRFLLGMGVSHAPIVAGVRGLDYSKPLTSMREYLQGMADSAYMAPAPSQTPTTLVAALGPRMLELAASAADGAHPYFTTPEHTETARAALGPDKLLCVEQKVILSDDPSVARATARQSLAMYIGLPNYYKNWFRLGYTEDDLADGGSDRLVDGLVAWGTVDQIEARLAAHTGAGADHVCIQPLTPSEATTAHDEALQAFAP